jgi:sensor histidine kinase YesM
MYITWINRLFRQRVLLHVVFWLAVLVFFNFVFRFNRHPSEVLVDSLGFLPGHLIFVYTLTYFLFPRYVLKGKLAAAIVGFILTLAVALFYMRIADVYLLHYSGATRLWLPRNFPHSIYSLFSIGWIAVTIRLVRQWYRAKEQQQQLEKEKLLVELQLLKSQLHPHFLFNTLNSLYAFSMEKSDQAPLIVLKLSSLLRYILYECNAPIIPLATEIEIIKSYLHLESMRFGDRLECSLQFTGDWKDKTIAPLLLFPFVENSIKHGISQQPEASWLSLNLHVEEDILHFQLINSRDHQVTQKALPGGLGLGNVKKRLELLYPNAHNLKYLAGEDTWQVTLGIRLAAAAAPDLQTPLYATEMSYR